MQFSEHIIVFQGKDNSTPGSSRNLEKCINQLPNKHTDLQVLLDPETWTLPTRSEKLARLWRQSEQRTPSKIRQNGKRRKEQRWRGLSFPNLNRWRHSGTNWGQPILNKICRGVAPLISNEEQERASQKQPTPIRQNARGRTNLILYEEGDGPRVWQETTECFCAQERATQ